MKDTMDAEKTETSAEPFAKTYTKDEQGFYVRNNKPSSERLTDERLAENVRSLLEKATARR